MRLIDADVLIKQAETLEAEAYEHVTKNDPSEPPERWHIWNAKLNERTLFKYDLVDAPTIDAVHVVRCAECIHNLEGECEMWEMASVKPFHFCWWGQTGDGRVAQEFNEDGIKYRFNKIKASSLYGEMKDDAQR